MEPVKLTLPIISIAPYILNTGTEQERLVTAKALHDACKTYGFFYLSLDGIADRHTTDKLETLARQFFALPQEQKDQISLSNQDGARGYQRLKENVTGGKADNHEGLDSYHPVEHPDKTKTLWGENQWPAQIPEFEPKFSAWIEQMKALGLIVMKAMADGLGLSDEQWKALLRNKVDDSFWVLRVIGYPRLPDDDDGFSCGAHKDYGCLTFLYADGTPRALQVFLRSDVESDEHTVPSSSSLPLEGGTSKGKWIYADPIPGHVVCNIGEMWEVWTNGLYKSTLHRVIHRGSNYRVSVPFFFEPNFDALVEPLPGIEGPDGSIYDPVVYGEFLMSKVSSNFTKDGKGRYD